MFLRHQSVHTVHSNFMKLKNGQNKSMVVEVSIVTSGGGKEFCGLVLKTWHENL